MNKEIMIAQQEFGQKFLDELNLLTDYAIKCFIADITTNFLGSQTIDGLEKENFDKISVERIIKNGKAEKITLNLDYESIIIDWNRIRHKKENMEYEDLVNIPALAHCIKIINRTYVQ